MLEDFRVNILKRDELLDVNINTGMQSINTERVSLKVF